MVKNSCFNQKIFIVIVFLALVSLFSFSQEVFAEERTCQEVCKESFGFPYGTAGLSVSECLDDTNSCSNYPKFDGNSCYSDCKTLSTGNLEISGCDPISDQYQCVCIKKTSCDSSENNCYDEDGCYACEIRKTRYTTPEKCVSNEDCCESASLLCDTTTDFCYDPDNNFNCISSRDCYSDEECISGKCDIEGTGECECSDRGGMCVKYSSHCADDLRCNDEYSVCYDPDLTNLVGGDSCFYNRECASRECDFNAEGTTDSEGKCLGVDRGKKCDDETDCASGLLCSGIYCYDSAATLNDGWRCYHDDECRSEICDFDDYYDEDRAIGRCKPADVEDEDVEDKDEDGPEEDEPEVPKPKPPIGSSVCDDYCFYDIEPPEDVVCICNPLSADSFEEIIDNLIDLIFSLSLVIAPLMIVWSGGLYITSGGNPEEITKAKNIIIYTLTGFAVILLSKGFVEIIKQLLGA